MARTRKSAPEPARKMRPALDEEARQNQMISYAVDLAEKQLREGTASSQVITHFLKLASLNAKVELEILENQRDLLQAKTEQIRSSKNMEEIYTEAIKAMKSYSRAFDYDD